MITVTNFLNKFTFTIFLCGIITGCVSGGSTNDRTWNPDTSSASPVLIDSYSPVPGPTYASVDNDIFAFDINQSGADEVVIAGRGSQPFTVGEDDPDTWQNYEIQVFGWNTGDFANETATWFTSNENSILGTEPSVHFGDFDGDGNVDMAVAHGTDMELYGPSYIYFNTGEDSFERTSIDHDETWAHDAVVADFNGDGFDDFLIGSFNRNMSLVLGGEDRELELFQSDASPVGIGLAAGDFLNDGSVTFVSTGGADNQELYSLDISEDGELTFTRESNLPDSRFELPKWDDLRAVQDDEYHTIRAITFDFVGDGIDHVVTISTLDKDDNVHGYTEVQFLKNDGSGNFTDVTDDLLVEFDTNQIATYSPQLIDINGNGRLDIFLSTRAFHDNPSTSVLVQQDDGTFREEFVDEFEALNDTLVDLSPNTVAARPQHAIVQGPEGENYIVSVSLVNNEDFSGTLNEVFLTEIGQGGTITVASTVDALINQWPWMTNAQANEILSITSSGHIDGIPIIDYRAAMAPVGSLSLRSKNGEYFNKILGHIGGVSINNDFQAIAVDDFGRGYEVDISPSVSNNAQNWNANINSLNSGSEFIMFKSKDLVNENKFSIHGTSIRYSNSDVDNYSIILPAISIRENMFLTPSFTEINYSPWLNMSGMWGEIEKSSIVEGVITAKRDNWITNIGLMHTTTEISPGLITDVNDIFSVWGEIGWRNDQKTSGVYAGFDPVILDGSVDVSIPTSFDENGELNYTNFNMPLNSAKSVYVRAFTTNNVSETLEITISGVARENVQSAFFDVDWKF